MKTVPKQLFHSSMFLQDELMPGFKRSGKLTEWDHVESNKYLYATSEKDQAIIQGFISACEKNWDVVRTQVRGKKITIQINGDHPSKSDVEKLTVYLYTIDFDEADGWEKNNNAFNGMLSEWVTENTIRERIVNRETVNVRNWLSTMRLEFVPATADAE